MDNTNLNIEQTLNEVKEGIMNNTMTKEQAELLIKKCDILIKKNKRNHEMTQSQSAEKQSVEVQKEEKKEAGNYGTPVNEMLVDTLVIREEREGDGVRGTVENWFGINLEEWEDGVYVQNECGQIIYFFGGNDILVGMSIFYGNADVEDMEARLDEAYEAKDGYWYDRRTDCDIRICQTRKGLWLLLDWTTNDYDRYRNAIRDFENSLM